MSRLLLSVFLFFVTVTSCLGDPGIIPKERWWFTNETEMGSVIPKHINDMRATYRIILRARDLDLSGQATALYRDLINKRYRDPRAQAAYAFSHFTAVGPYSSDFRGKGDALTKGLRDKFAEADVCRQDALTLAPDSPEVHLMAAIPTFYLSSTGRKEAYKLVRKAIRLAPSWGDTH